MYFLTFLPTLKSALRICQVINMIMEVCKSLEWAFLPVHHHLADSSQVKVIMITNSLYRIYMSINIYTYAINKSSPLAGQLFCYIIQESNGSSATGNTRKLIILITQNIYLRMLYKHPLHIYVALIRVSSVMSHIKA